MKKIIVAGLVSLAGFTALNAEAHDWHRGGYYRGGYYRGGCWNCGNWLAPALIGGVIGYELSRPAPIVVEQQPIVVQPQQMIVQQPPEGYHWQQMVDPQTNTVKIVLVPN